MAKRRRLFSSMIVLTAGALAATVLPTTDGLALPSFGPDISTEILADTPPTGLIVITEDDVRENPGTGRSQRRIASQEQLSESDRSLLDAVDDALGVDRVPRHADGTVDVPSLLSTVGVERGRFRRIARGVWLTEDDEDSASIARLPGVLAVEQNFPLAPADDPLFGEQWGLWNDGQTIAQTPGIPTADIGWRAANTVADGSGVVVAVIDSGIDLGHPDLSGSIWVNEGERCGNGIDDDENGFVDDCNGFDFVNRDGSPFDTVTRWGAPVDNNHGTHVAGIIAATAANGEGIAGVAPGAEIMSVKVFENGATSLALIIEALDYASANGADVINLSLGSSPGAPYSLALDQAVQRAEQRGALVVVAAGNDGVDIDRSAVWPASLTNPNVITVGASTNRDEAAGFSNYGRIGVDLFAPGYEVVSTVPGGYARYHGTSMAAPMVSGIAARVLGASGQLEPSTLREAILSGTAPVAAFAGRSVTGGRASAAGALGLAVLVPRTVVFTADGLGATDNEVNAVLTVGAADAVSLGMTLELTLGVMIDGRAHAVIGHDVGIGADSAVVDTSEVGSVTVELSDSQLASLELGVLELRVGTTLPDGDYVVHLGGSTSAGERLSGTAVGFTIGEPARDPIDSSPDPGRPSESGGGQSDMGDDSGGGLSDDPHVDDPDVVQPPPGSQPVDEGGSQGEPGSAPGSDGGDGTTGGTNENGTVDDVETELGTEQPDPDVPGSDVARPDPGMGVVSEPSEPSDSDIGMPEIAPPGTEDSAEEPIENGPDGGTDGPAPGARLFPTEGPDSGGTIVKITGTPDSVTGVLFGAAPATVVLAADGYVLVETPRHVPGPVDVVVFGGAGPTVITDGFRYLEDALGGTSDTGTAPEPGDSSSGGDTDPGAPPPTTEPQPGEPTPVDPGPIDPAPGTPSSETTTTTTSPVPAPTNGALTAGSPRTLANGLTVDAFAGAHPLASGFAIEPCGADDCRAVPVS